MFCVGYFKSGQHLVSELHQAALNGASLNALE
jgi:hypothetical protein